MTFSSHSICTIFLMYYSSTKDEIQMKLSHKKQCFEFVSVISFNSLRLITRISQKPIQLTSNAVFSLMDLKFPNPIVLFIHHAENKAENYTQQTVACNKFYIKQILGIYTVCVCVCVYVWYI